MSPMRVSNVYRPWALDVRMLASAIARNSRVSRPQRMLRLRGSAMPAAYPWRGPAGGARPRNPPAPRGRAGARRLWRRRGTRAAVVVLVVAAALALLQVTV